MAEESRFDIGAIVRAVAVIVGVTAALAFIVPIAGALADGDGPLNTQSISGHEAYQWGFWILAYGLTVWQGSVMLRQVHDRIIDDMLITGIAAGILLFIVKVIVSLVYEPISSDGDRLGLIAPIDAGGALLMVVVALVAARANRY